MGPFEVALADDEILTAIEVPALPAHTAAAYLKYGLLERPSVGVAVAVTALPNQVHEVRVAVGCVGPTPTPPAGRRRPAQPERAVGGPGHV